MKIHPTIYFGYWPIDLIALKTVEQYKCLQSRRTGSIARLLSVSFGCFLSNILW
ncbi:hypothetical protein QT972_12175 [Microcoleus sp. herbarium7]